MQKPIHLPANKVFHSSPRFKVIASHIDERDISDSEPRALTGMYDEDWNWHDIEDCSKGFEDETRIFQLCAYSLSDVTAIDCLNGIKDHIWKDVESLLCGERISSISKVLYQIHFEGFQQGDDNELNESAICGVEIKKISSEKEDKFLAYIGNKFEAFFRQRSNLFKQPQGVTQSFVECVPT